MKNEVFFLTFSHALGNELIVIKFSNPASVVLE